MIKSVAELRKFLNFAKKQNIKSFTIGEITVHFNDAPMKPLKMVDLTDGFQPSPAVTPFGFSSGERPPSEDEMLFASTDHFDVLRAERKEATQSPEMKGN